MTATFVNNKDRHFKGQYGDEEVIAFFREHWITLFGEFLWFGLLLFVLIFLGLNYEQVAILSSYSLMARMFLIFSLLFFTYFIHRFFFKLFDYFLHTVICTNFRIVEVSKVFYFIIFTHSSQQTFDMKEIQDIQKQQDGFWKNLFRFGTLVIMMSSSDTKIIRYVPNPDYHFRLINRIKRVYIQQRAQEKQFERYHGDLGKEEKQTFSSLYPAKNFFLDDIVNLSSTDNDKKE